MLKITIDNLLFHAFHGVLPQENLVGNEFRVDLEVCFIRNNEDKEEDSLEEPTNTISYVDLYKIVKAEMEIPRKLLETVAVAIVKDIRRDFPFVKQVNCKVSKLTPPIPGFQGTAAVEYSYP